MIDLTDIEFQSMEPMLPDYGVLQKPVMGVTSKIGRIGGGFVISVVLPPMLMEPDGRRLIARLQRAKREGARIAYTQVDFNVGAPGSPTVDGAVAGGMTLPATGATANYAVAQGQALNVTKADRTYLYFVDAQALLDSGGAGAIPLTTPLRTQLAGAEEINLAKPAIEGWITSDLSWPIDLTHTTGLSFTIEERA